jgi:hypothetical protein
LLSNVPLLPIFPRTFWPLIRAVARDAPFCNDGTMAAVFCSSALGVKHGKLDEWRNARANGFFTHQDFHPDPESD